MSTELTSIFGNEITVGESLRQADREFTGLAGSHGMTGMLLGSRGRDVIVRGTIRGTGASYAAARADVRVKLALIEDAQWLDEDDYTFFSDTYESVVWNKPELVPNDKGQIYIQNSAGEVMVNFIMYGISLK